MRATTCPYCGVGCGVLAAENGVRPDPTHPSSLGRICAKGAALAETLIDAGRLTHAAIGGVRAGLDVALDHVGSRFRAAIDEHGPDSVAFYLSGQLLTEDYYVANKLMKGFIGSSNIDTNSRLCMASTVAGHKRAFGADVVPNIYDDFDEADLLVVVGSNAAWCHPILHGRALAARGRRGTRMVVIDPRRTDTAAAADLFLPVRPDGDVALFVGLLGHLRREGAIDQAWVAAHAVGLEAALEAADALPTVEAVATATGLEADAVGTFFAWFTATDRTLTLFSQGVNQSVRGTDKVNAILNVHLATGRIGRTGSGPLSLTGQPNAMGGREVGGLATTLAAHMDFDAHACDRVGRFWGSAHVADKPGLTAVELFDAVAEGRVQALWIAATNPAVSMPRASAVREAIRRCPFVVVSDCWPTDTTALADVVLPAAGWGEKDGVVTNSERRISRQRAFRRAPGEATADWRLFAGVAQRLGHVDAFGWSGPHEVFAEWAALTAFENEGRRPLDLSGLCGMGRAEYDAMRPVRWPVARNGAEGGRMFAAGGFPTADGRARMIAVQADPVAPAGEAGTLRLNTGRVRDQWHTMTRTGLVPGLMEHRPTPQLALNPADMAALGLRAGDPAEIRSAHGVLVLPVVADPGLALGDAFAPMHWSDRYWSGGVVGAPVHPLRDPVSRQPALKTTPVHVTPLVAHWHGVVVTRQAPERLPTRCLAGRVPLAGGVTMLTLLGLDPLQRGGWRELVAEIAGGDAAIETVAREDVGAGTVRVLGFRRGRGDDAGDAPLGFVFALARTAAALPRGELLAGHLGQAIDEAGRSELLGLEARGRAPHTRDAPGRPDAAWAARSGCSTMSSTDRVGPPMP